jgi:hypothetical protein
VVFSVHQAGAIDDDFQRFHLVFFCKHAGVFLGAWTGASSQNAGAGQGNLWLACQNVVRKVLRITFAQT